QHALLVADRGKGVTRMLLDRMEGQGYPVASIVQELADKAGVDAAEMDLTDVTDSVPGYIVARPMAARQAIEPLMKGFFFDACESDSKLKFVKRGHAPIFEIPYEDLAAHEDTGGDSRPEPLSIELTGEEELPGVLNVHYMLAEINYDQDMQPASREVASTRQPLNVELPMVLSRQTAAQAAEVMLYNEWVGREKPFQFSVSRKYARQEPCDVGVVIGPGGEKHTIRLTHCDYGNPGIIQMQAVREQPSVYQPVATGGDDPGLDPDVIEYSGPTVCLILDTPALRDQDNNLGVYFAACGLFSGWDGCALYVSRDSGATWDLLFWTDTRSVMGVALDALPEAPSTIWDEWNTLTVRLRDASDVLASCTEEQALAGANSAWLNGEVVSWQHATLNADGSYTLSRLIRGRRGTEWAIPGHLAGDSFVLLDPHRLGRFSMDASDIGHTLLCKAVSHDETLSGVLPFSFTFQCASLEPYAPCNIHGRLQDNGDVLIGWTPRARYDGEWRDLVESVQSEPLEKYTLTIATLGGDVVRTVEGLTAPAYAYAAADITSDLGGLGSGFMATVQQISQTTGPGFPGTAIITGIE
ncbi:MAG: phage tail protein, partial [Acidobacteriota bacterium]